MKTIHHVPRRANRGILSTGRRAGPSELDQLQSGNHSESVRVASSRMMKHKKDRQDQVATLTNARVVRDFPIVRLWRIGLTLRIMQATVPSRWIGWKNALQHRCRPDSRSYSHLPRLRIRPINRTSGRTEPQIVDIRGLDFRQKWLRSGQDGRFRQTTPVQVWLRVPESK
jgi:hypothetical protein